MASRAVEEYRRRFPETGVPAAQEQERAERLAFKQERRSLRRTGRTRGVVVPDLPWHRDKE